MGGGDLNMKKSWHPGLIKNRAQVWEDQHAALQERKRMEALKKEIEEERAANELQKLNEANGGAKRQERVEFLYAGPGAGAGLAEDREAYLLGRKRIDDVLGKDVVGSDLPQNKSMTTKAAPTLNHRDLSNKVALDPLLAIKKQEAAQYEAMVMKKKAEMEADARKQARREARNTRSDGFSRSDRHPSRERHSDRAHDKSRHHRRDRESHRRRSRSADRHERYGESSRSRNHSSRRDRYPTSERHGRSRRSYTDSDSDLSVSEERRKDSSRSSQRRYKDEDRRVHTHRRARSRSPKARSPHEESLSRQSQNDSAGVQITRTKKECHAVDELERERLRAAKLAEMSSSARDLDEDRARRMELSKARDEEASRQESAERSRDAMKPSNFVRDMQLTAGLVR